MDFKAQILSSMETIVKLPLSLTEPEFGPIRKKRRRERKSRKKHHHLTVFTITYFNFVYLLEGVTFSTLLEVQL